MILTASIGNKRTRSANLHRYIFYADALTLCPRSSRAIRLGEKALKSDKLRALCRPSGDNPRTSFFVSAWIFIMSHLDKVATTTLLTDNNKDLLARMLETALQQPLVPMEPAAAKQYMEQVATRTALDDGVSIRLFQMVQLSSSESVYVMRVALLSDYRAIGLDIMDAENGQFFIPESCPVCQLAAVTVN